MIDTPNTAVEIAKIVTEFLSDNSIIIFFLVLIIICRDAISSLISRIISLSLKKGDSELGVIAVAPVDVSVGKIVDLQNADEKPTVRDDELEIEDKTKEKSWFFEVYTALEGGQLEVAETAFKKYALEERDEVKLEENRAAYLYYKFDQGKDNTAVEDLEDLVRTAKTEESKFNGLTWLSFCISDSMQHTKEVDLWEKAVAEMKSQPLITKAIVNLSYALKKENQSTKARWLLIKHLSTIEEKNQKAQIFEALSKIEESLGNKDISVYCKDKSLEFDPNNRDELFNSAYSASNEDIDDISIGNYLRLMRIDSKNSTALNNLGVRAQEAGLKITAVEKFKKASGHGNTLAMANQGYLLLGAGFTEEAEEIANKALELEDTHKNIYSLITAINEQKEEQKNKWEELSKKALKRQNLIRSYIEQYYVGYPKDLEGEWFAKGSFSTEITINNDKLEASWEELATGKDGSKYSAELIGSVSGSSFSGIFTKKVTGNSPNSLLGIIGNTSNALIGFISDDGDKLILFAPKLKDEFSLFLSRTQA